MNTYLRRLVSENTNGEKVYVYECLSVLLKEYHIYILRCWADGDIVPVEFDKWLNTLVD